jgi:uncharacterized repeat protein (TIGR01451 family)
MWILAACGLTGLALGVGNADERDGSNPFSFDSLSAPQSTSYFSRSGQTSSQPALPDRAGTSPLPTRYSRQPDSALRRGAPPANTTRLPGVETRNYYDQLFGGPEINPASSPTGGPPGSPTAAATPPAGDSAFARGAAPASARPNPFEASASNQSEPKASPFDPKATGVVPARYDRVGTGPRPGEIQQVRAADDGNPFAPPPDSPLEPPPAARPTSPPAGPPATSAPTAPPSAGLPAAPSTNVDSTATGPQTPSVTLQWIKKSDINVGQECACDLVVKNSGKVTVRDVGVEAYFPRTIRLTGVEPAPQSATDHLAWTIPLLEAGAEKTIHIRMIPSQRGELATSAFVRFTGAASGVFTVEEPLLKVALQGPSDVSLGDPASQTIAVSNPGNGPTKNVVIEAIIPAGLEHPRGERLVMNVGSISPGEVRQVRLGLIATRGGRHTIQVQARADGNLQQQAMAHVNVIAPSIQIAVDGPGLRYVGRGASYVLTVTNDGSAVSNNVRVTHRVPDGFKFVSADRGGQYESQKQTINWFVGRMEPGQSVQLKVDLEAMKLGNHTHVVAAVSEHGATSEAKFDTTVDGASSLVLEVVDLDDPVEVGAETAYEIRVKNEGSKAAQNVAVGCELPEGVVLVGAKGPMEHRVTGGQILFQTLKELEPGKTALYRVHVRGAVAGSHRFRAQLKSDSSNEPLTFEELTKFYGEK